MDRGIPERSEDMPRKLPGGLDGVLSGLDSLAWSKGTAPAIAAVTAGGPLLYVKVWQRHARSGDLQKESQTEQVIDLGTLSLLSP